MRISIIGAGRVAYHLAQVLSRHHQIVQIYSRSLLKAERLAQCVSATATDQIKQLNPNIDLAIIAVQDNAIQNVITALAPVLADACIVHTSGSTDLSILAQVHRRVGVFYPLQTFSFESTIDWQETPLLIEAQHEVDQKQLLKLAYDISQHVYLYNSAQRLSLHLAAVFACNFSNYCYDMAKQIVDAQGVSFNLLHPLILETAKKATQYVPKEVQTGPAKRDDSIILELHERILEKESKFYLKEVYTLLSQGIKEQNQ